MTTPRDIEDVIAIARMRWEERCPQVEMRAMESRGAPGTICARFYDAAGKPLRSSLDQRTLAITQADLRRARLYTATAFGDGKRAAISAALRGGWINGIGTDTETALALLAATDEGGRQ